MLRSPWRHGAVCKTAVNTPAACGCRIGSIRRRVVDLLEPAPVSAQCPELPAARRPVRRQRTACTDHVRVRRNTPALPVFATAAGPRSRTAPDAQRCHETISRPCPSALSGHFDLVLSLTCVSLAAQKQPPTMTTMNSLGYFSEPTCHPHAARSEDCYLFGVSTAR